MEVGEGSPSLTLPHPVRTLVYSRSHPSQEEAEGRTVDSGDELGLLDSVLSPVANRGRWSLAPVNLKDVKQ